MGTPEDDETTPGLRGPVAGNAAPGDAGAGDAVTEDATADDAVTEDATADDAVTEDATADDAAPDDAAPDDAAPDDAAPDDAAPDDAAPDDAAADDAAADDAVTDDAAPDDAETGDDADRDSAAADDAAAGPVADAVRGGHDEDEVDAHADTVRHEFADVPDPDADTVRHEYADVEATEVLDADVVARESAGEPAEGFDPPEAAPARRSWAAVSAALRRPRMSGAGLVIALLIGLLGFGLIAQVQSNANESTLTNDRPEDLVRILADLDARKDRLNGDITTLRDTQQQLSSGVAGKQAAIEEARKRAAELGILAGTLPAEGPGLRITLEPDTHPVNAYDALITVESLRGAGAEAMQISGTGGTVRVVASTYFVDAPGGGVDVGGTVLTGPLTLDVIGSPQRIETALNIPGEVVDTVHNAGGNVLIVQLADVKVTALHTQAPFRYARPVA